MLLHPINSFSTNGKGPEEREEDASKTHPDVADPESADPEVKTESLQDKVAALEAELKVQRDGMLRALADGENARTIARRDVENAQQFAVTKFAKSLLEVADNLNLAVASIRAEEIEKPENEALKNLMQGVSMTESLLTKAFEQHGLVKYAARGDKFDPNLHDALFEIPDPELEAGTLGQVVKAGYTLKGRVIRPAQVGTVRKS